MKVEVYSRDAMEELKQAGFPKNVAVISFYTPTGKRESYFPPVDYRGFTDRVFYVGIVDIDIELLPEYGYTYETYIAAVDELAAFIRAAHDEGLDIICQCDWGQSRSAGCAAAILQHFEARGIDIFADYRYYPNQLVYHRVFEALEKA